MFLSHFFSLLLLGILIGGNGLSSNTYQPLEFRIDKNDKDAPQLQKAVVDVLGMRYLLGG